MVERVAGLDAGPAAERPTARRWAVRAGLLVVTWAGLTGLLVAVGEVVVHSSAIQEVDRDVMSLVVEHRTPVLNTVMQVVTWFGSWMAVAAAAIVVVVLVVRRLLPLVAVPLAVVAWAGEISGVTLAKNIVQRPRPPERVWVVTAHGWSWPSGHAAAACLVFTCLAAVVALLTPDPRPRVAAGIMAAVAVAAVAVSRVELGVHWTTDVIAGATFTACWLLALAALVAAGLLRSPARAGLADR